MFHLQISPVQLREADARGENLVHLLKGAIGDSAASEEIIELAYDLQAGSYVRNLDDANLARHKARYSKALAGEIRRWAGPPKNVLEAGVGEATTLSGLLTALGLESTTAYGFDLSWSRVAVARKWLEQNGLTGANLCTGNLFQIPLEDSAVDVVYTSHTIEPNGGREVEALLELYRVTGRYLFLLEPGYEIASSEGKQRMERHGYCRGLEAACRRLGFDVVEIRAFEEIWNPLNPTQLIVIKKGAAAPTGNPFFSCPLSRLPLQQRDGAMYSEDGLCVYPIIDGIPCLRTSNAVIASHYEKITSKRSSGVGSKTVRSM